MLDCFLFLCCWLYMQLSNYVTVSCHCFIFELSYTGIRNVTLVKEDFFCRHLFLIEGGLCFHVVGIIYVDIDHVINM